MVCDQPAFNWRKKRFLTTKTTEVDVVQNTSRLISSYSHKTRKHLVDIHLCGLFYIVTSLVCWLSVTGCLDRRGQEPTLLISQEKPLFTSSGGVPVDRGLCPKSPRDVIVPLGSLNPEPKPSEPEMTVDGIMRYVEANKITSIKGLLDGLPTHYRTNFSMVEKTRATGQASLEYPRIILFGSDAHFMMNVGTKPDDPKYDILDVAELHEETGEWEFSAFDFSGDKPKLERRPESCLACHGKKNPRPFWGTNQDWPGVFGDNIAAGPQGEALDHRHAQRMNEIASEDHQKDRFGFLIWTPETLRRGAFRRIAHHVLGAELLLSNIAMGSAVGRGLFVRLKGLDSARYKSLRSLLVLLGYVKSGLIQLSEAEQAKVTEQLTQFGEVTSDLDGVLRVLGVDPDLDFSLGTLADQETPQPNWKLGRGDLYELVLLQVLHDLSEEDDYIRQLLLNTPVNPPVFACPDVAKNIQEVVEYKMLHLFELQGAARYEVNRVYYAADAEDIYRTVFAPSTQTVGNYLRNRL